MRQNKDLFEVFVYYRKYTPENRRFSLINKGNLMEYQNYGKVQIRLYFVAWCSPIPNHLDNSNHRYVHLDNSNHLDHLHVIPNHLDHSNCRVPQKALK